MYEVLKNLYESGRLPKENLKLAVSDKNWITVDQYKEITGEVYA